MAACGANCTDAVCYTPVAPLAWANGLGHAARFHSDEMLHQSYLGHDSLCSVVVTINSAYPGSCNGSAACACNGGAPGCPCTAWFNRISLFGSFTVEGEIISTSSDPQTAIQQWLYEPYNKTSCGADQGPPTNIHRWNLLKDTGAVGFGVDGASPFTGDFAANAPAPTKLVSGAHYPQQASSIDFWANWYDTAGPMSATVVVDGCPQTMTQQRGVTAANSAWRATVAGLQTGCHRYYFLFKDSIGTTYKFPDAGSFAVGTGGGCPDYDASTPATDTTAPVVSSPAAATVTQTLCQ